MKKTIAVLLSACCIMGMTLHAFAGQPFSPANKLERKRQALYCFLDSAFSPEYNDESRNFMIRWGKNITISVEGGYTKQDMDTIDAFIEALNKNVDGIPKVSKVAAKAKAYLRVIYAPLDQFGNYISNYVPNNWGYFSYRYNGSSLITSATILIATDVTKQSSRNHLILEEITGALGLTNDIYTYSDSIVYAPWTETQELSDLDWLMLNYLYSGSVNPGMTAPQAYEALLKTLD